MGGDKAAAPAATIDDGVGSGGNDAPLGVKLRRAVSVRKGGGLCTPPPSWKLEEAGSSDPGMAEVHRRSISARKLGAGLWEIQDPRPMPSADRRGSRIAHQRRNGKALEDDPHPSSSRRREDWDEGSLRKHGETSLSKHHDLNDKILQLDSPASYTSRSQISSFGRAINPVSAVDHKGMLGDAGFRSKRSTELLKVFNHIWSLEEQQESNAALVKALKMELEHAQARIKELMQERHAFHNEMDRLGEQINEANIIRRNKEHQKIQKAVQSIKEELEDERRLRRRSESLHRKLGRELSQAKAACMNVARDLEKVSKTNLLLEELCDAFAKGISDYEHEVRLLKQKSLKVCDHKVDRLVLHIAEAWLDEREQMNIAEAQGDLSNRSMVTDRLGSEIEAFIQANRSDEINNGNVFEKDGKQEINVRRQSLESMHLNGTTSAPQDAEDDDNAKEDDNSVESDLHCFELNDIGLPHQNVSSVTDKLVSSRKLNSYVEKIGSSDKRKNNVLWKETEFCGSQTQHLNGRQGKLSDTSVDSEGTDTNKLGANKAQVSDYINSHEASQDMKSLPDNKFGLDHLKAHEIHETSDRGENQNDSMSTGKLIIGRGFPPDDLLNDTSTVSHDCIIDQHKSCRFRTSSSSLNLAGVNANTLKARLLEARLEGHQVRLKASRGSSIGATRQ
ncbi:uncharacterized protein At5g41620-like [Zingiber officinale]|uniref:uncharacterized protein At5g41620-like n=1 Tax=Zingiber officinale TaxID=94328 RepID=UPI001C4AC6E7|nr:uncharacterized protein At5g41620-like [Zingiber officinale]